jgi:alkylation response protein AidB-like acyl-CoA dehydrogenase
MPATTPEEIAAETTAWAEAHWDPDLSVAAWWRLLAEARYSLPTLPDEAFGRGYDREQAAAVTAGLVAVGTVGPPGGIAPMMAAPTIATHGTPAQIERYIPPILDGRETWCQLFSEPGAGSDLAGLQSRAVTDGDQWIVTGQKVWTSLGQQADLGMLLARTDPDKPKHRGLAWFAFPMLQDGVEVRPLREMTGRAMFNEVFLDAAVVSDSALIGTDGDGWRVGNTTLFYERASLGRSAVPIPTPTAGSVMGQLEQRAGDFELDVRQRTGAGVGTKLALWLADLARELGRADDPVVRDRLAHAYTLCEVNRLSNLRAKTASQRTGAEGNIGKLAMSEMHRQLREVGNLIVGAGGMVTGPASVSEGRVQAVTIGSPAPAIYGGTDQVQRNIIGERVLGLPKEPGPAKDTPFSELPAN